MLNRSWALSRPPYPEGLRTLKTAVQNIFGKIFPEAEERTKYRFPEFLLFDTLFDIGYATFLIPFRISKSRNQTQFKVTTNIVQQIISTIVVLCASIHSLLATRTLVLMDLKKNPSDAFAVIFGMFRHCFPVAWFYTFWCRRRCFTNFLRTCQASCPTPAMYLARVVSTSAPFMTPTAPVLGIDDERFNPRPRNSVEWKLALICRLAVIVSATKFIVETVNFYLDKKSGQEFIWKVLGYHASAGLYIYRIEDAFVNRTKANVTSWIENRDVLNLTIMSTHLVLEVVYDAICNYVDAFCLLGATVIFSICYRFSHEIPKIKGQKDDSITNPLFLEEQDNLIKVLERMSTGFMEMNNVEEAINSIFGPIFLLYILGAFPSLAGFMMFKQRSSLTGENYKRFSVIFSVTMHTLTAMIASEGSSKMGDYKCWLFDVSLLRTRKNARRNLTGKSTDAPVAALSNAVLSRLNHLHREAASNSIGLKGCGFFTMTHGLIGTMLGIFVTFAIVIVQFEMV